MKLSPTTLQILKNYATINSGLWIDAGNVLKTVSPLRNVLAEATIPDEFPTSFGIFDLNQFLSILSMHKDGLELEFDDVNVIIMGNSGRSKIKYRKIGKDMIVTPPDREMKPPPMDVSILLQDVDYNWVMEAAKILKSTHIGYNSDGNKIFIKAFNKKDNSQPTQSLELVEAGNGNSYDVFYETGYFGNIISGTYDVQFGSRVSSYKHTTMDLNYYISFNIDSTYGE